MINKFYLLCVIFSGSPDLTLKTCLVYIYTHTYAHAHTYMFNIFKLHIRLPTANQAITLFIAVSLLKITQ